MTADPSDRTIILHLLRGAVPERANRISSLWTQYGPTVEVTPNGRGMTMNANASRIKLDTKMIDFFWLFGFSAWRSINVYSGALEFATRNGHPLATALKDDTALGQYELDYKQHITIAQSLIAAEQTDNICWPADIPRPTDDRYSLSNDQHKAAFDLVALALAFAILHEFRHVMYCSDKSAPTALPEEEIACDTWARDFMTSKLAFYAKTQDHTYDQVLQKRAMGIALAAVTVHVMTPSYAHWGNGQYPPIAERLTALIKGYNLPPDSCFWAFTACLLIALMRKDHRPLDIVCATTVRSTR